MWGVICVVESAGKKVAKYVLSPSANANSVCGRRGVFAPLPL